MDEFRQVIIGDAVPESDPPRAMRLHKHDRGLLVHGEPWAVNDRPSFPDIAGYGGKYRNVAHVPHPYRARIVGAFPNLQPDGEGQVVASPRPPPHDLLDEIPYGEKKRTRIPDPCGDGYLREQIKNMGHGPYVKHCLEGLMMTVLIVGMVIVYLAALVLHIRNRLEDLRMSHIYGHDWEKRLMMK